MSKKHKNRNHGQNLNVGAAAPQAETTSEDPELKAMMEEAAVVIPPDTDEEETETEETTAEETTEAQTGSSVSTIMPTAEAPKVEEPKKTETVDLEPPPAPVEKKPTIRIVPMKLSAPASSDNRVGAAAIAIQKEVSEQAYLHTPGGRKIMAMFDEYAELCKNVRQDDVRGMTACARKLYDIMVMACPAAGTLQNNNYNELIKIVFKRLSQGYGNLFTENSLFRVSYNLPTPTDSMKFDAFYNAMYQLVECAKSGERIRFNTKTLGVILNSPSAIRTITDIRRRLEAAHG